MAPRVLGSRSSPSSFPPGERCGSSLAIRRRFATHGFVAGYRSSPCLRLATSAAHRRRPVPLRSLLGRVPRPRPNITCVLFVCFCGGLPLWAPEGAASRTGGLSAVRHGCARLVYLLKACAKAKAHHLVDCQLAMPPGPPKPGAGELAGPRCHISARSAERAPAQSQACLGSFDSGRALW